MPKFFYATLLLTALALSFAATGCKSTSGDYGGSDGHAGHSH